MKRDFTTGINLYGWTFEYVVPDQHGEMDVFVRIPLDVVIEEVQKYLSVGASIEGNIVQWSAALCGTELRYDSWTEDLLSSMVKRALKRNADQDMELYEECLALLANELRECMTLVREQRVKCGFVKPLPELLAETQSEAA